MICKRAIFECRVINYYLNDTVILLSEGPSEGGWVLITVNLGGGLHCITSRSPLTDVSLLSLSRMQNRAAGLLHMTRIA